MHDQPSNSFPFVLHGRRPFMAIIKLFPQDGTFPKLSNSFITKENHFPEADVTR